MESQVLPMPSKQPSRPTSTPKDSLINEWLTRFSVNAGTPLGDKERAVYLRTWKDGFADLDTDRLKAAFVACLRSHTFKTIPTIGDVRQHLQKAESQASEEEAAQWWDKVLAYAVRRSPDYPDKNPPQFLASERIQRAIRSSGGLDWIRDCPSHKLEWARKNFIEAYVRHGELQQSEYLLPKGKVKDLLATAAQKLLASPDAYEEARKRGIAHSAELKATGCNEPDIQRAMRTIARESAPLPSARSLEEQKQTLREKGFLPQANLGEARP